LALHSIQHAVVIAGIAMDDEAVLMQFYCWSQQKLHSCAASCFKLVLLFITGNIKQCLCARTSASVQAAD
jgi:hypothetical protein